MNGVLGLLADGDGGMTSLRQCIGVIRLGQR